MILLNYQWDSMHVVTNVLLVDRYRAHVEWLPC